MRRAMRSREPNDRKSALDAFGRSIRSRRGQPNRGNQGDVGRGFLVFHGAGAALLIAVAIAAAISAH